MHIYKNTDDYNNAHKRYHWAIHRKIQKRQKLLQGTEVECTMRGTTRKYRMNIYTS
jgi:hypothetical protein